MDKLRDIYARKYNRNLVHALQFVITRNTILQTLQKAFAVLSTGPTIGPKLCENKFFAPAVWKQAFAFTYINISTYVI